MPTALTDDDVAAIDAYWRAANYLTVGQIYLRDNALLREPLRPEHIKPRLLGHWGTSPGLSILYAHLNRVIRERDADVIFITGPGHGGPAVVANVYLEGTYSEIYPVVSQDHDGMRRLFRQFSTPGGVPSHVSVPTPGSIHEGGELGYALVHAFGATFDNPDLVVACVVGDGEAETGPLSGSWQGIDFLNPVRDGAVLPILHLNGYKISGPTVFGRASDDAVESVLAGYGYDVHFVEGDDPQVVHRELASTLDRCFDAIKVIQDGARAHGFGARPRWPAIVLRTPKGWTGPKVVDGLPVEGTFRAHQVPLANVRDDLDHLRQLEEWMRGYRPDELFDGEGRFVEPLAKLAPEGDRRMGANPHANGGELLQPLDLPDFTEYAISVESPGADLHESTRRLGEFLRDVFSRNEKNRNFRLVCPDETNSNRLGAVFDVENRVLLEPIVDNDDHVAPDGRVMEVLSEHNCQGWLEGYVLTGRHGVFASYEAFAMVSASMTVQHAKWLEAARDLTWRAPVASLNVLLTSTCWRNDHNGFSHQGPGLIDTVLSKKGTVSRIYLPPDANSLLAIADHCLRSRDYVNLIVIDKQPQLQWLDMDTARQHAAHGASVWDWAGNEHRKEPEVVLASAGDIVTMETVAAAQLLRQHCPEFEFRVVNVVDLMALFPEARHPHGMGEGDFVDAFTADTDVVFAFHGYQSALHHLIHGRPNPHRFHVRGYQEEGTTTTPFDMVVRNEISRYHLCIEAMHRSRHVPVGAETLVEHCKGMLRKHERYVVEHLEDMPEVRDWRWSP
ncbi:MAG TPA: phosphoketolase family protein [Acidimicrobiia bacterium]|nr:phosphoketolase family protein [Acidimicrobiia bacterium]